MSCVLCLSLFSEFLMDLDCLSENVSISGLSDHQLANSCAKKDNNICKKHKYYPISGCCANLKLTHFTIKNQDSSKRMRAFEL